MARTSSRLLTLLSLLGARNVWSGRELADRLGISTRTLRRDVESLRELGYPARAVKGPDGGYQLGAGSKLPPLLLDDEQAVAIAVALQTAPASVTGLDDALARALTSIKQVMPVQARADAEAMHLTAIRNAWDFSAPPIAADTVRAVGHAVRNNHLLRFDYRTADGRRPHPSDPDFTPPLRVEPHHLVVWAGRWYLVAYCLVDESWAIYRLDRIRAHHATGMPFQRRALPQRSVAGYVMTTCDRGDTPARWQCRGTVIIELASDVVARWAPGGSVVERISDTHTRLTLGAWSWAGIAGLLGTFDADITDIEPHELHDACRTLADRYRRATQHAAPVQPTAATRPRRTRPADPPMWHKIASVQQLAIRRPASGPVAGHDDREARDEDGAPSA